MRDDEKKKRVLTAAQAKLKAENYCAYQERAQQEVRDKLYDWGLHQEDVENIIVELISDNFLNEERFALAYASGKFRMKGWGKIKIKQGLTFKKVSPPLIRQALAAIDYDEYLSRLADILQKKAASLKEDDPYIRKNKLAQYAAGRGFESTEIWDLLKENTY
ncbi:regulatory protein RecX [Sphingobacterium spiritivorum]|uniref:Regulatory protein RecX n=1 Tax=Sphingobacterium spiritivorum ATCC 33861 TaxID=525373 RepID=D7VM72_SPHSI|nr:regulatory protein RecX [Sphingobacterium spiritivorum]EFK58077.1 regulatory protein RecX [Sphingobacterium spiritivorum ATCC 33861]QQT34663.1 RecX family transcriptional regulator [Sphingobacterium spiritivorum]WQD35547.1 regulatory protein RecX [Sphingobacterium spiritivorum]SUJ00780.1 recombination regulator RecX [Sphingobacterium spiritivorum]